MVARQELGPAVDDNIGPEVQRILEIWREKCIVNDEQGTRAVSRLGNTCHVGDVHHGVRGGLQVYGSRARLHSIIPI